MTQLKYFLHDLKRMLGKQKLRIFYIWLSRSFWGIWLYRIERSLYLLFGKSYSVFRIVFLPVIYLIQAYSNLDIHYKANIKGGLLVLHPSIGCVISGQCSIGSHLTLTGGNVIGAKEIATKDSFVIGNFCEFGANAVLIGPLILGNHITIGASACVVNSELIDYSILVGIPAIKMVKA